MQTSSDHEHYDEVAQPNLEDPVEPSIERAREFRFDWILEIGLRNLVIVLVVAGGLHLLLYTFKRQSDDEHYDARPLIRNSKRFHFGNQVWDNMFWTLVSAVAVWS